ncbi:hypothetical protein ACFVHB_31765 [Kitasatospora sp. NPDC127111]|uniref:hypothetical protein n=1 Tax=Kitasatospora sp. NPDC127111 TaxID=3345363 RepID=UPI003628B2B3
MLVETLAFVLVGLVVGATALLSLPAYFPSGRALTMGTALVSALLSGVIAHFALNGAAPAAGVAISATASALLTSVLARPDLAAGRRPAHRHHPHRAGAHHRHRHA